MSGEVRVLNVTFGDQWVEVQFVDEDLDSTDVKDLRIRLINPTLFRDELNDIQDSLVDILGRAEVHRRNPPSSFRRTSIPPLTAKEDV